MTRADVTASVLEAKRRLGLSWKGIAETLGGGSPGGGSPGSGSPASGSPVFYTAALLGHQRLTPEEAQRAATLLELDHGAAQLLAEPPEERGASLKMPPTDPLIYRFYELVQGYGPTLKALINEEFGDGIMSAIDFSMSIGRQPDPKGDRVKIEMSGKFLPYKRF
jgi:cyanate lyase